MARGDKVPAGVRYFNPRGMPDSTKGSKHPQKIGAGLETTKKLSGNAVSVPSPASGSATFPSGVNRGSGTERRRGTSYKSLSQGTSGPGGSKGNKMNRVPSKVTKTDGKRGKRPVKEPF